MRFILRVCFIIGVLAVGARSVSAQATAPLLKTDLIELLSSPVIRHQEVAALVRRNCLAFRPTQRDWLDFRGLRASDEVVRSIAECDAERGPVAPRPAPRAAARAPTTPNSREAPGAVQIFVRQPRLFAVAGSQVRLLVLAARAGMPEPGVQLALRGSGAIDGGPGIDQITATDDSGFGVFPLNVGRRLGTYRLEVAPAAGGTWPGRPMIDVTVRPGAATAASVEPREIVFDQGLDSIVALTVVVKDSLGFSIPSELVVLRGAREDMRFPPDSAATDSLGRARFALARSDLRRGGKLQVMSGGRAVANVEVIIGMPLSPGGTGFLPLMTTSGVVHSPVGDPVVFEARTRLGYPAVARAVAFRGINADVAPASAATDSAGRVRLDVTLGGRAGPAIVVAKIDTLERMLLLQVEPGSPVALVLDQGALHVEGEWLVVPIDTTFVLRVRALDASGSPTSAASLVRVLSANRARLDARLDVVRLLSIQEEPQAAVLTFKAIRTGRGAQKLNVSDLSLILKVQVVPPR